ncbi:swr complex subunit [Dissophora globulifera]|uniref:SWR1-complex protein 4 n=1 Tax=Dissophora globulifera TaxID=979702 RepID=A0A9P6UL77_9FUNG|nr:swr complex subunit [Dissophora globulifera]
MATGNDVREIFQLKPSEQIRRVHKPEKKPGMSMSSAHGISRELYGLIGNNVSTVAFNNPTYKPKLNVSKKAVNWTWRPFMNPSRDDDMILHHWEKTRTDPNEEYRFYKFNKAINLNEFTSDEYTSHLQDSDWSLEETNYLWDLCRRFDLRWVVIQDRYEWPPREQDRMALTYYNGNNLTAPPPAVANIKEITEAAVDPLMLTIAPSLLSVESTNTSTAATPASATGTGTETATTMTSMTPSESEEATASSALETADVTMTTATDATEAPAAPSTPIAVAQTPAATSTATEEVPAVVATTLAATPTTAATTADSTASATATATAPSTSASSVSVVKDSSSTELTTAATVDADTSMEIVSYTPAKTRSMEELKNRYYAINRILIKIRMSDASQAVEKAQLLSSMAYDKNREVERKKNLEILNTRTPEQIEEEEALYLEARRIDQNERKITRERENLLRLLSTRDMYGIGGPASAGLAGQVAGSGGPGTGIIIPSNSITIPSSNPSNTNAGSASNNNSSNGPLSPPISKHGISGALAAASANAQNAPAKKRKKAPKGSTQAEEAVAATAASASASSSSASGAQTKGSSSSHRRPSNASSVTDGSSSNLPQGVQVKKEKLTPGAYLRSQKMTPIVSTKQQRVQATLTQLGLPLKPAMPTATVMAKWDQLTNNVVTLLDLKKQVDKLEADLKVVKMRRGSASGVGLFPAGSTAATGGSAAAGGSGGAGAGAGSGAGTSTGSLALAAGGSGGSLTGSSSDSNFGVKREGTVDETGTPGQLKKKKRKE